MINPLTLYKDIELAAKAADALGKALPLLKKLIYDVREVYTSGGNAEEQEAALAAVLDDIKKAVEGLAALFPPPAEH